MFFNNFKTAFKRLIPMIIYMIVYMTWFTILEKNITTDFHLIHMKIDDYIPFIEYFIIPYDMWFLFVGATLTFLAWTDNAEYQRTCWFICFGMTLFLIISTIYPNGHDLRPEHITGTGFCAHLVRTLHSTDTPTNLFPSIHVYNSVGMFFGLRRTKALDNHKWVRVLAFILCVAIILATVFLKQHSVFDIITAFLCIFIFSYIVYHTNWIKPLRKYQI